MRDLTNVTKAVLGSTLPAAGSVAFETVEEAKIEMVLLRQVILEQTGGIVWEGRCKNEECAQPGHAIQSYDGSCACNTCGGPIVLKAVHEKEVMIQ